jgi:hypothetical protein
MRRLAVLILLVSFPVALCAQAAPGAAPQTPRQALLDMVFSKDRDSVLRHLPAVTVAKLKEAGMEEQVAAGPPLPVSRDMQGVKTFDTGPVLLSVELPKGDHFQLTVLREDVQGTTAFLELGFSGMRAGQKSSDISAGIDPRILIRMIQEAGVWKLADLGFSAHVPLDDPKFLDAVAKEAKAGRSAAGQSTAVGSLRTLNTAQLVYKMSYDRYTCSLAQLGGVGKGDPTAQHAQLIDESLESGTKSGYLFKLTRCDAAGTKYRASAAPATPGAGPAYCTDESGKIRKSDDGNPVSCFVAGKPVD